METVISLAELRSRISSQAERPKGKSLNYELLANLYMALHVTYPAEMTLSEKTDALHFCINAARTIPHSSMLLELVQEYAACARTLLDDISRLDPTASSTWVYHQLFKINNYEAIVARQLDLNQRWKELLDSNIAILERCPDACENIHNLYWGLSIWHSENDNPEAGLSCALKALEFSRTRQSVHKTKKIAFFNLYKLGRMSESIAYVSECIDSKDFDFLVDIVWFLLRHGVHNDIKPTLERAIQAISSSSKALPIQKDIKRISIELYRLLDAEQSSSEINETASRLFLRLRELQNRFLSPEFLSAYSAEHIILYEKLICFSYQSKNTPLLLETVFNMFLTLGVSNKNCASLFPRISASDSMKIRSLITYPVAGVARLLLSCLSSNVLIAVLFPENRHDIRMVKLEKESWSKWATLFTSASAGVHRHITQRIANMLFCNIKEKIVHLSIPPDLSGITWTSVALYAGKTLLLKPVSIRVQEHREISSSVFYCLSSEVDDLAYARHEVDFLKKQIQSDFYYEARTDIETITGRLESAKFFHFTGHGYGGIKSNGGLVLGDAPGSPGASMLSYSLIRGLNLSGLRLAFLNCCQSGHAKSYPGNIATDISSSFLDAGTNYVVASVNNVDDFFAYQFASSFYKHLFNNNWSIVDAFYSAVNEIPGSEKYYTLFTSLE